MSQENLLGTDAWPAVRLRHVALINPLPGRVDRLPDEHPVSFLPMEAIGEDGRIDLSRTRPLGEVRQSYTYFEDGDVVFAKVTPCFENGKGALLRGLADGLGFGTTELTVLRPGARLDAGFLSYFLSCPLFRGPGAGSMTGAGGLKRVPEEFTRNTTMLLPSLAQQQVVTRYLDRETARIDALIEKKTRFIELLREKRQALITQTVTQGLDPAVPMKDSGVAWLGRVPAHWEVRPLKFLTDFRSGGTPSKENRAFWDGDVPWASAKDLKADRLADTQDHLTTEAVTTGAAFLVPAGAVLVVVRGMILARTFPVSVTTVEMAINQDLKALVPRPGLTPEFLAWLLRGTSPLSLSRLEEAAHGTKALRMEAWIDLQLPVPPPDEQQQIASRIEQKLALFDAVVNKTQKSIGLLSERRSALITAAVTGQIDLREAA